MTPVNRIGRPSMLIRAVPSSCIARPRSREAARAAFMRRWTVVRTMKISPFFLAAFPLLGARAVLSPPPPVAPSSSSPSSSSPSASLSEASPGANTENAMVSTSWCRLGVDTTDLNSSSVTMLSSPKVRSAP